MLDEIPKLFGRGFVVGYLLPSLLFVIYLTYGLGLDLLGIGAFATLDVEKLGRAALAVLLIAFAALLLNRPFVRILEGYYRFNPLRLFAKASRLRFEQRIVPVQAEWKRLEEAWAKGEDAVPAQWLGEKARLAASAYPYKADLVLATRFGNTYRAFENYPLILYGMDAVVLWPRLSSVLPKAAQDQLAESRARLDFHVTLFWLGAGATVIAIAEARPWLGLVQALPPLLVTAALWATLPTVARSWGTCFTSMFDLYRRPLARSLGLDIPATMKAERQMWYDVGRTMLYRRAFMADSLDPYRQRPETLKSLVAALRVEAGSEVESEED